MPAKPQPRQCSIANALGVIGERWSLLAIREITFGVRRFDQIVLNTGASRDILSARLRKLVGAGVLETRRYEEHPPRYEYLLTEAGLALQPVLLGLMEWGDKYVTAGEPPTVWQHDCGAVLEPRMDCAACGKPVRNGGLHAIRLGAAG